jgi:hypothetical protein
MNEYLGREKYWKEQYWKESGSVASSSVIRYVQDNFNPNHYETLFVGGSVPEIMVPQSDLDIYVSVKSENKNDFFSRLTFFMDSFIFYRQGITYSTYRGPLKYKNKGLIHFLCYTSDVGVDLSDKAPFRNENRLVLKSLLKNHTLLGGATLKDVLKDVNLEDTEVIGKEIEKLKWKLELLKTKGYNCHKEWKLNDGNWEFTQTKKYCSDFLKDYLIKYYEKYLGDSCCI